jgi:hypothetical protein
VVVVGLVGEMRSGKTLLTAIMLHDDYIKGKQIMSNFDLSFPHEPLDVNSLDVAIREGNTDYFNDKSIGIDEIHVFMDARGSGQKRNKMMSYFLTQSGKLDTTIYWTSQFMRQVDVRLRLNTQILYKIRRYIIHKGQKIALRQDDKRTDFYIDAHKHFLRDSPKGMVFYYQKTITIKNPSKYFGLYNTKQRVYYKESIDEKEKRKKENTKR